jgi:hypothetical protein
VRFFVEAGKRDGIACFKPGFSSVVDRVVRHDSPLECAPPSPGEGNRPVRSGRANVAAVFDDDVRPVRCQATLAEIHCQRTLIGGRFIPPLGITPRRPTSWQAPENDDTFDSAGQQHLVRRKNSSLSG